MSGEDGIKLLDNVYAPPINMATYMYSASKEYYYYYQKCKCLHEHIDTITTGPEVPISSKSIHKYAECDTFCRCTQTTCIYRSATDIKLLRLYFARMIESFLMRYWVNRFASKSVQSFWSK